MVFMVSRQYIPFFKSIALQELQLIISICQVNQATLCYEKNEDLQGILLRET